MTACGWLFDLYPHGRGMRLWFLHEDGGAVALWEPYAPTFYVRASRGGLEQALGAAPGPRSTVAVTPVKRRELWSGDLIPVFEVRLDEPERYAGVVQALSRWRRTPLELFTCDIPLSQRYCYDRDVFPLAFCAWEADGTGRLTHLQVLDDALALDYRLPSLSRLELRPEGSLINPRHGSCARLEVWWEDTHRVLEGDDPGILLDTLHAILAQVDPDVIFTHWGDAWILPTLEGLARPSGRSLPWHRETRNRAHRRPARSYVSYGRMVRREAAYHLAGRWHLDQQNTFLLTETGLEGVIELARLCRIPVQQLARTSPGTAISSLQLLHAHQAGILIPWRKQEPEWFKSAEELLISDKGGLVFVPEPGVYGDIAELDFASLYPTIMARYNISPETLDCPCCPESDVPELRRRICRRRRGLIPQVLEPVLQKRARLKALKQQASNARDRQWYERCQTALKWILVTCFGYLGYKNARFGRIEAHEAVTAYSRELLLQAKEVAETQGFRLLHAIVDSLWVQRAGMTEEAAQGLAEAITHRTGVPIAVEGVYRWLMFPPARGYSPLAVPNRFVGVFNDGSQKVRGLELRRRDTPPFLAEAQQALLEVLSRAETPEALFTYVAQALEILKGRALDLKQGRVPLASLAITKQVSQDPEAYRRVTDTAIVSHCLLAHGVRLAPGETVQWIITSAGDDEPAARVMPLAQASPDRGYDRDKYLELLLRSAETVLGPLGYDYARLQAWVNG